MAPSSLPSSIRDNHTHGSVGAFLKDAISPHSTLSIVSAYFTIYAFAALQGKLYHTEAPTGVERAIMGSSNFTVRGLGFSPSGPNNIELNLVKVQEFIEKRNDIAHTSTTNELTQQDVVAYLRHSRRLVRGIDVVVGKQMQRTIDMWPWSVRIGVLAT